MFNRYPACAPISDEVEWLVMLDPVGCLYRNCDNLALCCLHTGLIILLGGWESESPQTQFPPMQVGPRLPHKVAQLMRLQPLFITSCGYPIKTESPLFLVIRPPDEEN